MPRDASTCVNRASSASGNGAKRASAASSRRTAVMWRSGVSGRSTAPSASRASAASSALSVSTRLAGSMAQHSTKGAKEKQIYWRLALVHRIRVRLEHHLDAPILVVAEHRVALGRAIERKPVRDHE